MSAWLREEKAFERLLPERQANIEIVSSAYASLFVDKAYLTMPITTGRRYYATLDKYGVHTVEELEKKRPGALREEIILPNLEAGRHLAEKIKARKEHLALIVPGVFEARKQRWTQEEYMVLWLRLITGSIKEIYLSEDWEYSNGGAIEFTRATLIAFGCMGPPKSVNIWDHVGNYVDIREGAGKLVLAIRDLGRRGFDTTVLRNELAKLAGLVETLYHARAASFVHARLEEHVPRFSWYVVDIASSVGVSPQNQLD